jgi:hypothetical protein
MNFIIHKTILKLERVILTTLYLRGARKNTDTYIDSDCNSTCNRVGLCILAGLLYISLTI